MGRSLLSLISIPVTELRGVGEKKANGLKGLGIENVYDLVTFYPRRYVDRSNEATIITAPLGEEVLILGRVRNVTTRRMRGGKSFVEAVFFDSSGSLKLTFFNQPWRERQLRGVEEIAIFGKVDHFRGALQMANPLVDQIGDRTGKVVPIYARSEKSGLTTWEVARFVEEALDRCGVMEDPLSEETRLRLGLVGRTEAFRAIHFPATVPDSQIARKRLAFDEVFRLQLVLLARKRQLTDEARGISHDTSPFGGTTSTVVEQFFDSMPFPLTGAQRRVIGEIARDMAKDHPMHRLLQGDVGAGKTLVALASMLFAIQGGHQAALLAPTEVLAEQHLRSFSTYLSALETKGEAYSLFSGSERPITVQLLTGKTPVQQRRQTLTALGNGSLDIVVGTHALLSEGVEFASLGLAVVDEQHRFGVEQRSLLKERARASSGRDADVLVMTATPIPRTAAMTVYGDLDVSVLDELPPGRTPVQTVWAKTPLEQELAFSSLLAEIESGRQGYVVCPLVEESETTAARSAVAEFERLSTGVLKGVRVGLMHGQMKSVQKEEVMASFRSGTIDVLVATTVIEVGVDVPNASIMVIEDAGRFGLAQLHQLRGRVGRGSARSYCFLLAEETPTVEERLKVMTSTNDGFEVAERDLELRGEGTILGARQQGRNDLKLASIARDRRLIGAARETASSLLERDPRLEGHPLLRHEVVAHIEPEEAEFLFRS